MACSYRKSAISLPGSALFSEYKEGRFRLCFSGVCWRKRATLLSLVYNTAEVVSPINYYLDYCRPSFSGHLSFRSAQQLPPVLVKPLAIERGSISTRSRSSNDRRMDSKRQCAHYRFNRALIRYCSSKLGCTTGPRLFRASAHTAISH